jgi:HK97 family phage major capsid protein
MWGLPAVPTNALAPGQALVGAFGTAARVFIREAVNVRLSDADQDDLMKNRLTALAELRAGLAVWQPSGFCLVHLEGPTP